VTRAAAKLLALLLLPVGRVLLPQRGRLLGVLLLLLVCLRLVGQTLCWSRARL
jgi:hypothetical protein